MAAPALLPDPEQIDANIMGRSFPDYIRGVWPLIEPSTVYQHNWHIDAIAEHLTAALPGRQIRSLLITVPPRHMKSLAVSVCWPTWLWAQKKLTGLRFLYASYAETLSIRDSIKCRRIIESIWYRERWPHVRLTSDQNVKVRFENDATGYRIATSVAGATTGEGGDLIVTDDPANINEAHSETIRKAIITWWSEVMSTRLNDPKTGVKVIIMQRIHEDDLVGHILKTEHGWTHLSLPAEYIPSRIVQPTSIGEDAAEAEAPEVPSNAIASPIGWTDPRTERGELLWPERFGPEEIARLKASLGSYAFSAQFQQRPVPDSGGILARKNWRFYATMPTDFDDMVMTFDMAFKNLEDSSYVVGGVWGRKGSGRYLLDLKREHLDFNGSVKLVEYFVEKWPQVLKRIVEDKANGPAILAYLGVKVSGLVPFPRKDDPVEVDMARSSKEARAFFCQPFLEAGNVWLPEQRLVSFPVEDFISECSSFPVGTFDDQVDMFTMAMIRLFLDEMTPKSAIGKVITLVNRRQRQLMARGRGRSGPQMDAIDGGGDPRGREPEPEGAPRAG